MKYNINFNQQFQLKTKQQKKRRKTFQTRPRRT